MPEIDINIGGRVFQVACQEGEEHFLQSAAALLDTEAQSLADVLGRVPESRMLLMAGLMLADKTAGLEEELRVTEQKMAEMGSVEVQTEQVEVRVEVPVIPDAVNTILSQIADRTEEIAASLESTEAA